jgi:Xaa-Pro aminopeptidase
VRPGVRACDLYAVAEKVLREHNVAAGSYVRTLGHGLGLGGYGPPLLTPSVKTEIKPNMVLAVEPNMLDKPFSFSATPRYMDFAIEDDVVVTASGHEILTPLKRELWIL